MTSTMQLHYLSWMKNVGPGLMFVYYLLILSSGQALKSHTWVFVLSGNRPLSNLRKDP